MFPLFNTPTGISSISDPFKFLVDEKKKEWETLSAIQSQLGCGCFRLTGSRRFGTAGPFSDYDFFIAEAQFEMHAGPLKSLGFVRRFNGSSYRDPSVESVWEYRDLIDIQVIRNEYFNAKLAAQDKFALLLKHNPNIAYYSKKEMSDLWATLIWIHQS